MHGEALNAFERLIAQKKTILKLEKEFSQIKNDFKCLKKNNPKGSSNHTAIHKFWRNLWNLNTIPRHKALVWRIIDGAIPIVTIRFSLELF
jgi:hypothetical protein